MWNCRRAGQDFGHFRHQSRLHVEQGLPMIGAGAEDGFRTIELAYAAYEALEKGTVVKLG